MSVGTEVIDGGNVTTGSSSVRYKGAILLTGVSAQAGKQAPVLNSSDYGSVTLTHKKVKDHFGTGSQYTYTYQQTGKNDLEQIFYFYPNHDYLLTEMAVVSPNETTSYNYLAPIVTSSRVAFLPADGDNRVYDMPFDNDDWRGYSALTWAKVGSATGNTSCEAGVFYDVKSRKGLVIGSVEHDT